MRTEIHERSNTHTFKTLNTPGECAQYVTSYGTIMSIERIDQTFHVSEWRNAEDELPLWTMPVTMTLLEAMWRLRGEHLHSLADGAIAG
jgi:hypothetical protein